MDAGYLQVDSLVPQGPLTFVSDESGLMKLLVKDRSGV
jgi:hypothetical protein